MTKEEILSLQEKAEQFGLKIMPESDLNNLLASKAAEVTRETATKLESTVEQITGIKKAANEKYYDYTARVLSELAAVKQDYESVKGKDWDKVLQAKEEALEQLRKELQSKDEAFKQQLTQFEQKAFNKQVENLFSQAVSEFKGRAKKFDGLNTTELVEVKAKAAFSEILSKYTPVRDEETGDFIGFVETGTTPDKAFILRDQKSGRVLGFSDFLENPLKDLVTPPTARTVQGTGANASRAAAINSLVYKDQAGIIEGIRAAGLDPLSAAGQQMLQQIFQEKRKLGIS